jgi:hypothetical protein
LKPKFILGLGLGRKEQSLVMSTAFEMDRVVRIDFRRSCGYGAILGRRLDVLAFAFVLGLDVSFDERIVAEKRQLERRVERPNVSTRMLGANKNSKYQNPAASYPESPKDFGVTNRPEAGVRKHSACTLISYVSKSKVYESINLHPELCHSTMQSKSLKISFLPLVWTSRTSKQQESFYPTNRMGESVTLETRPSMEELYLHYWQYR